MSQRDEELIEYIGNDRLLHLHELYDDYGDDFEVFRDEAINDGFTDSEIDLFWGND